MRKTSGKNWLKIISALLLVGVIFLLINFNRQTKIEVINQPALQSDNKSNKASEQIVPTNQNAEKFFVSGWLPYWKKTEGVDSLEGNLALFSEVNPFAFGVNPDGSLRDTMQIGSTPWPKLKADASRNNVKIIPTIIWADAKAMHQTFSDPALEDAHIENITRMLKANDFSGVDIDYEGKDVADRDLFSAFLEKLHQKLLTQGKSLSCTVEARTQDETPKDLSGTRAMSYANDFSALNNSCDTVRLMAYDQVFQIHRSNIFEDNNSTPLAPNADNAWVQSVIDYALRYILADKIVLGVPTYGWEFQYAKLASGYRYTRIKSVSYPEAIEKARSADVTPERIGGELSFTYQTGGEKRLVAFSDAEAIREKIDLAKKNKLKGINLFKLDGLTDPGMFLMLGKLEQ